MLHINLPTDFNTKYKGIKQFAEQAKRNTMVTHDAIIVSRIRQTVNANKRCRPGEEYSPGDLSSNVVIELPEELKARKIHTTLHNSHIRPYIPNNDMWFPNQEAKAFYDFGKDKEQEWFFEAIIGHE
ncbi:hypothetical protein M422DRAFT_162957 [Sphaerobolus stellatus SS14]|nr:hypothetical protein M422DRAFT_162957 [Sphaerobolus stellatus SS14]